MLTHVAGDLELCRLTCFSRRRISRMTRRPIDSVQIAGWTPDAVRRAVRLLAAGPAPCADPDEGVLAQELYVGCAARPTRTPRILPTTSTRSDRRDRTKAHGTSCSGR